MTWKTELADMLDQLGTHAKRLNNRPLTFQNLDELVFQLRKPEHDSDCATHNEPDYPNGPCDCSLSARADV